MMLRARAGASVRLAFDRPPAEPVMPSKHASEVLLFGNCLVMTGISPKLLAEHWVESQNGDVITNIATHEQSPLAYFTYLEKIGHYPNVVIANVSSWINGTNFDQEAAAVIALDPLGAATTSSAKPVDAQAFRGNDAPGSGAFQRDAEAKVAGWASEHVRTLGRRYHLFDFTFFTRKLLTSVDLDESLYQLNMQSWFQVTETTTDGRGYLGLGVRYRDDWNVGLERMAERSLQRMQLSNLLTPEYWKRLEQGTRSLQAHGTRVVLVRMPEHPRIRAFNEARYQMKERLAEIHDRTNADVVDLSALGPSDGVRLFDGIHPDDASATAIARALGAELATHDAKRTRP